MAERAEILIRATKIAEEAQIRLEQEARAKRDAERKEQLEAVEKLAEILLEGIDNVILANASQGKRNLMVMELRQKKDMPTHTESNRINRCFVKDDPVHCLVFDIVYERCAALGLDPFSGVETNPQGGFLRSYISISW